MLNETIRALRQEQGLSQQELADRLHVVRQTLSKWEQGRSVPDAELLLRLARELGTTPDRLLGSPEQPQGEELGARLEALTRQLARRAETRRRRWRVFFGVLGGLALLGGARLLLGLWQQARFEGWMAQNPQVIGGADGSTGILLLGLSPEGLTLLLTLALALAAGLGLWATRRR